MMRMTANNANRLRGLERIRVITEPDSHYLLILLMFQLFQLFVFIFSVIVHEVSHGVVALKLGDTTARDAGRLTLNPLKHLELFGSFLLPLMLYVATNGAMVFGWA